MYTEENKQMNSKWQERREKKDTGIFMWVIYNMLHATEILYN